MNNNHDNNNSNNSTMTQVGSLTRIQHGGAPSQATASPLVAPNEANRVHQGATRMNMHTGELSQAGTTRYAVGQDSGDTSSVMATLQRVNGAETVELVPGVPGSRTHLRHALADGLIEPVGGGQYRDKGAAAGLTDDTAKKTSDGGDDISDVPPVDPGAGVFDPVEDEDWAACIEPLPQSAYDAAAASSMVAILSGADSLDKAAATLAEQSGMDPEMAASFVNEGVAMYERLVATEVTALGVTDKQAFYSWLRESKGRALQNAMQSLTAARNIQPFRTLAVEYGRYSSQQATKLRG